MAAGPIPLAQPELHFHSVPERSRPDHTPPTGKERRASKHSDGRCIGAPARIRKCWVPMSPNPWRAHAPGWLLASCRSSFFVHRGGELIHLRLLAVPSAVPQDIPGVSFPGTRSVSRLPTRQRPRWRSQTSTRQSRSRDPRGSSAPQEKKLSQKNTNPAPTRFNLVPWFSPTRLACCRGG